MAAACSTSGIQAGRQDCPVYVEAREAAVLSSYLLHERAAWSRVGRALDPSSALPRSAVHLSRCTQPNVECPAGYDGTLSRHQ